jgi:Ca-activated chloride channel homolog
MKKILFLFALIALTSGRFAGTQEREISGTVRNASDGAPLPGVTVLIKGTTRGTATAADGRYTLQVPGANTVLVFSYVGFVTSEITVGDRNRIDVALSADTQALQEVVVTGYGGRHSRVGKSAPGVAAETMAAPPVFYLMDMDQPVPDFNTEGYSTVRENEFLDPVRNPLSTFSIDVDAASYSNMRRFLRNGQKPPVDAVRIEEMINYFDYDYALPGGEHPFSVTAELAACPWNQKHLMLHLGLQGKIVQPENLPPSNLVFLIDVSGSMQPANKLPLLKSAFRLLVDQLRPADRVAIVVYAGAAGLVLPSTPGDQKQLILAALDRLEAGGSTAGGAGLKLAYQVAQEHFIKNGNNRIVLASDGDFNIGASSNAEMERLIEEKRNLGVFMTVLGFGMDNYKDDKMEIIANKGNGNYAYIDNLQEARKVLVKEFGGTLFTIAKDVKIQVEFNPAMVQGYRLLGYENRMLRAEDFNNDKKDAGELGSGHTVTALYEIVPAGIETDLLQSVDELKYQHVRPETEIRANGEWLTVKLRYKQPDGEVSRLLSHAVTGRPQAINRSSGNFRWSAGVALFGMILRDSPLRNGAGIPLVLSLTEGVPGADPEGYRAEFISLVKTSQHLASEGL